MDLLDSPSVTVHGPVLGFGSALPEFILLGAIFAAAQYAARNMHRPNTGTEGVNGL
jgi:hypothetical protein